MLVNFKNILKNMWDICKLVYQGKCQSSISLVESLSNPDLFSNSYI